MENIIGESAPMKEIFEFVQQVAPTRATVLILGESGTGKELIAKAIHQLSPRSRQPMVTVHCAGLPPDTVGERIVRARERGVHRRSRAAHWTFRTGAGRNVVPRRNWRDRPDNPGQTTPGFGERTFERVGSSKTLLADVRLVTATNKNLEEMVKAGTFREDLYYR